MSFSTTLGTCQVCGQTGPCREHRAIERIFYSGRTFTYLECEYCGSLTLANPPDDLEHYYPNDYYSFPPPDTQANVGPIGARRHTTSLIQGLLENSAAARGAVSLVTRSGFLLPPWVRLLIDSQLSREAAILDVGCGSGHRLRKLEQLGFQNLTGVDAYLPQLPANDLEDGLKLKRGSIADLKGPYDLIMFHHSLEHMGEPFEALQAAKRLLSTDGSVIIRVPLVQTFAWRAYGVRWVQLDAPRHHFLFTVEGLGILATRCGLAVQCAVYDSTAFQFWGSELHSRGIPVQQTEKGPPSGLFSRRELVRLEQRARRLNAKRDGDQAAFLMKHVSGPAQR